LKFERRDHGRNHSYWLDGQRLPGVTTLLNDGKPKPALVNWAAGAAAAAAVDRWDELAALPVSQRLAILRNAPNDARNAAALRGQEIHHLAWQLVTGEAVDVPDEHLGPVQAAAKFLDAHGVQPILREVPVLNVTHGWAGTIDLLARVGGPDRVGGPVWLLDWKTGRGVYDEAALQLAAYAHAEFYQDDAGELQPWHAPDRCGVVHLDSDDATLYPVDAGDATYLAFRYVAQVAGWSSRVQAAYTKGESWPIGAALVGGPR
jgi:hypothetical protein